MIRASKGPGGSRRNGGRGNVIYNESFSGNRQSYVQGTAIPDDFWSERSQEENHRSNSDIRLAARRSRAQSMQMNLRYVTFLASLVALMTVSLIGYIKLKADISGTNKEISSRETQLAEIKASNNEVYNEITGNIDLEQVRRIAIDEFGMHYADQDQIVFYSAAKGDQVRQVGEVEH